MAPLNNLQILITANEGYRAFERAVLLARDRIDMGFRVFDPQMGLLTQEARKTGETWADLLLSKLDQGVDVTVRISDFDPVVRPKLHLKSYKSLSILMGVAELVTGPGKLSASVEAHPARVGWAPRVALWPKVQSQIAQTCDWLNELEGHERRQAMRCMPRLHPFTYQKDGSIYPRRGKLPAMLPVTHHQKIGVIDDEVLYIGGLDLDERRFDTERHERPSADTWHDVHVMLKSSKLACSARKHLDRFAAECAGRQKVESPEGLLRTLSVERKSNGNSLSPKVCDTGIMDRILYRINRSRHLIYLENQFLRDPIIADALREQARQEPNLGLVILLPAAPLEVAYEGEDGLDQQYGEYLQAKVLRKLMDAFGDRMVSVSPAQLRNAGGQGRATLYGAPMIFVHSKVSVFDDQAGLVTSANLNGRSMRWDTEMGIEIDDPDQVKMLRERVMLAWLPTNAAPDYWASSVETVGLWRALAEENAALPPSERRGFLLPYKIKSAEEFGTPLPGIPAEMV